MTAAKRQAIAALRAWWTAHPELRRRRILSIHHVYPRAYVLARTAPKQIIVATAWQDAEPQLQAWEREHGGWRIVTDFDETLRGGAWCVLGYVQTEGYQVHAAVPVPAPVPRRSAHAPARSRRRPR